MRQAAAFYQRRGKPDLAEPLLRTVISLETPATLGDACWARRNLAAILAARGGVEGLSEAIALIDENLRGEAASIDDQRSKVLLLLRDPRKEKSDEALQLMEELVKDSEATADDFFALAKLYLKRGNRTAYEERMHSLLGAEKGAVEPEYIESYVGALLEKKQLDDADKWLRTLENMAPDRFMTVRLRADYEFLRGNYKDAGNRLMDFLDNPKAEPKERTQQLALVAQAMQSCSDRLASEGNKARAAEFTEKADMIFSVLRNKRSRDQKK